MMLSFSQVNLRVRVRVRVTVTVRVRVRVRARVRIRARVTFAWHAPHQHDPLDTRGKTGLGYG